MNSLTRIKAGEKFVPREAAYNAFCDMAERNRHMTGGRPIEGWEPGPHLVVRVMNNTGEQLDEFETFSADNSLTGQAGQLTVVGNESEVSTSPIISIGSLDKELGAAHLLIIQEPIPVGEIGRAVVRGVCVAKVEILSPSHNYADLPVEGSILRSGFGGRVRLLQVESASLGEQTCLVDLLQSPIDEAVVRINSSTPTGGLYPGSYAKRSTTSPYSYEAFGSEVRVICIGGGTLVANSYHIGKVVGTVTISDVNYDLVDVVGDANYTSTDGSGDENAWAGGLVSTTTQSFRGDKYFRGSVFSQDTAVYSTAYSQLSTNGTVYCTSGDYLGSTVNLAALSVSGPRPGLDFSHDNGPVTVTGGITFTEIDFFGSGGFMLLKSSAGLVIAQGAIGILQGSTIHTGIDAVITFYAKQELSDPNPGLYELTFKGGLLTNQSFTP